MSTPKSKTKKANTKSTIQLIDPEIEQVIRKYHAIKAARRSLEKEEQVLKEALTNMAIKYQDEYHQEGDASTWFDFNGAQVRPSNRPGQPRTNPDKLLERGVDPEIIAFATSSTPYTQYDTSIED